MRLRSIRKALLGTLLLALGLSPAPAAGEDRPGVAPVAPLAQPAMDGLFAAFKDHALVGVGDHHNLAELGAFYVAFVQDPRFAREVGNLVVEFGGAAQQDLIDRYVAGEAIPPRELRRVWSDVVGWEPGEIGQMYVDVFAAVRRANAHLPKDRRIKVWLGEPRVDWDQIDSRDDLAPLMASRNAHPAQLLVEQILQRRRKALVIYGGPHFFSPPSMPPGVKALVERDHPGAFYVVATYRGLATDACNRAFEEGAAAWRPPVLASPIAGTWIENGLRDPDCAPRRPTLVLPAGAKAPPTDPDREARRIEAFSGVLAHGLLYLGPASTLHQAPPVSAGYLDAAYLAEMRRREAVLSGTAAPGHGEVTPPRNIP